ncbi:uncharacterized protein [Elaeis guineensis]|uniref:uncharacterized protein n=1 Tax=Elaeis guineensis var. tenera TaxID=51953 RepID=UPI003C6CC562
MAEEDQHQIHRSKQNQRQLNSMKKSWSTDSLASLSGSKLCLCAPTKHAGSFRCKYHRHPSNLNHIPMAHSKLSSSAEAAETAEAKLQIGHQLFAYVEASGRMRRDLLRAEERCQDEVVRLQAKTAEVAALREALERERQDREEERQAREEERQAREAERRSLEESVRKAEAEVAQLAEQTPVLVSEARTLAVEEFKASAEMRELNVQFGLEAFTKGFELCREKVASRYPDLGLEFLEESDDEAGPSPAATAVAPPAPNSPPPAPECLAEALPLPLGVPLKSTIRRLKKEVLHLTRKLKKSEGELRQAKKCYSEAAAEAAHFRSIQVKAIMDYSRRKASFTKELEESSYALQRYAIIPHYIGKDARDSFPKWK